MTRNRTPVPTLTLTKFLLARIAEDEAEARQTGADAMTGHRWKQFPERAYAELQSLYLSRAPRALAECEARRRLVEIHKPTPTTYVTGYVESAPTLLPGCCRECTSTNGFDPADNSAPCETLLVLARPYADHPDYRKDWAYGMVPRENT